MSLWDELTPEQKEAALAYRGPENIGVLSRLQYVSLTAQKDRVIERQAEEIARLREALRPFATAKVNRIFPQSPIFHFSYSEQDGDPFENAIAAMGETCG